MSIIYRSEKVYESVEYNLVGPWVSEWINGSKIRAVVSYYSNVHKFCLGGWLRTSQKTTNSSICKCPIKQTCWATSGSNSSVAKQVSKLSLPRTVVPLSLDLHGFYYPLVRFLPMYYISSQPEKAANNKFHLLFMHFGDLSLYYSQQQLPTHWCMSLWL